MATSIILVMRMRALTKGSKRKVIKAQLKSYCCCGSIYKGSTWLTVELLKVLRRKPIVDKHTLMGRCYGKQQSVVGASVPTPLPPRFACSGCTSIARLVRIILVATKNNVGP